VNVRDLLDTRYGTAGEARTAATEADACLNCGGTLTGPYCASCGQKKPHLDLTLRELLRETAHELTNWEGRVPRTLKALFLEPGLLTLELLAGRRARWLSPLRLYLICSLAFFLSDSLLEAVTHRSARELEAITRTTADGRVTLTPEGRKQIEGSVPGRVFGRERIERAVIHNARFNRAIDSAYPKALFVLVPLFALLTSLAWRRKRLRYPAHLYLALHLHAAWFGSLALATAAAVFFPSYSAAAAIELAGLAYILWYGWASLRRVLGDGWVKTTAKAAAVAVVYCACLFFLGLAVLGYALATT
jgi:hypothetical protein